MRTQRSLRAGVFPTLHFDAEKRPICEVGTSRKRGANMGRTYFRFSCHSRRGFLKQAQITLIPAGLDLPRFQSFPHGAALFLGMAAIQKLALPQIGSELPEGLRQAVFQLQIQFLRFKGGKSR